MCTLIITANINVLLTVNAAVASAEGFAPKVLELVSNGLVYTYGANINDTQTEVCLFSSGSMGSTPQYT